MTHGEWCAYHGADPVMHAADVVKEMSAAYLRGYTAALDAIRERLIYVALNYSTDPEFHALAAVDAVRGKVGK